MKVHQDKKLKKAFKRDQKFAEKGNLKAQYRLATYYECGRGIRINLKKAIKWYRKAAKQGHLEAHSNLAYHYKALNGKKEQKKALKWTKRGAKLGEANLQNNLANYYFVGEFIKKNLCTRQIS